LPKENPELAEGKSSSLPKEKSPAHGGGEWKMQPIKKTLPNQIKDIKFSNTNPKEKAFTEQSR